MSTLDELWSDPAWREVFRLAALSTSRPVLGYAGSLAFDPFRIEAECAHDRGASFGKPWLVAVVLGQRYALLSGRCESTIGNGSDEWTDGSAVDVQIAETFQDLCRWAMTTEERERLGVDIEGRLDP